MKITTIFVMIGLFICVMFKEALAQYQTLRQPDGTTFQAVERGEQFLQFLETPEGFIVRRGGDGYYRYFNMDALGEFVATGLRAGIDLPVNVPVRPYNLPAVRQTLIQKIEAFNAAADANRQRYLQRQRGGSSGMSGKRAGSTIQGVQQQEVTLQVGVLLVEFNDVPHYTDINHPNGYSISEFETMLFSNDVYKTQPPNSSGTPKSPDNEVVFGSLRDYFEFQSHGLLHVTGQVINPNTGGTPTWLNMGNSSNYNSNQTGPNSIKDLLKNAINAAIGQGWNVNYDIISMVLAQDQYAPNVGFWTGYGYFQSGQFGFLPTDFNPAFDYANWFGGYVVKEREDLEWRDPDEVKFTHIGIHCHEMFHVIGWGMYNILGEGGLIYSHPITNLDWSSMGDGYRTGLLRKTESPGDLDAVARVVMEWATPTLVNGTLTNEPIQYLEMDNNPTGNFDFYQFNNPAPNSTEQFIIENRQYSGFNSYLPEWWKPGVKGGLLVWWRDGQNRSLRLADNDTNVVLEGMPNVSSGDLGDPFPGDMNNTVITMSTTPNTNAFAGGLTPRDPTGFAITNISSSATTVTATFRTNCLTSNSADAIVSNGQRKLARESNGVYHLVFETGGEIYYQKSTDGGVSWSAYKRLSSGSGDNKYPCVVERSGKLYVVWQQKTAANTYTIRFRHFNSSVWDVIRSVASGISLSGDPLPAIAIKPPTGSPNMMVVYRTGSGLKYRRSTSDNGSSWLSEASVTSNTNARNPSLVYRVDTEMPNLTFNVTWDDGSNIFHQIFNSSGSTWNTPLNISNITTGANHQYSSYALSGAVADYVDRHVVWQALEQEVYGKQAVYHNKNVGNAISVLASGSYDHLRPSITGHANGAATVVCHDNSSSKNIRKRRYDGAGWQGSVSGSVIAANGVEASLSVANPPGAIAEAVWRSAGSVPYTVTVGPSGGLNKAGSEDDYVYHRRIVYTANNTARLMLQVDQVEVIDSAGKSLLPFAPVGKDSLFTSELAEALSFRNIILPDNADSLALTVFLYGKDAGRLRKNQDLALFAAFELSAIRAEATPVIIPLPAISTDGEFKQAVRLIFPAQSLRAQAANLVPKFSNVETTTSQGALLHIYEAVEKNAQKADQLPIRLVANNPSQALAMRVHPNPFNPSTQVYFTMPVTGVAKLRLFNLRGQFVRTLLHEHRSAGEHMVMWDGRNDRGLSAASGVYFICFEAGREVKVSKVMLVR
jgi:M6 family metalloprotease-like protein